MTWGEQILISLASDLAYDLLKLGGARLRDIALGDEGERALQRLW